MTAKELTAIETAVIKQIRNPFVNINKYADHCFIMQLELTSWNREEMILDLKASQELPSWDSVSNCLTTGMNDY
jgi:hypothetical protein